MHQRQRPTTTFAALATAVVAGLVFSGCAPAPGATSVAPPTDEPLPSEVPNGTSLVVADQNEALQTLMRASGEHDKLSASVEYANFLGGPAILEAIRAEAVDLAVVGDTPPIQAQASGEAVPIVAAKKQSLPDYRMAVAPGVSVKTLSDLKGKRITYGEGTGRQPYVLRALRKAGLTTEDVQLVPLKAADFPDAIRTGQVDVAVLNEPHFTRYLTEYRDAGATAVPDSETEGVASGLQYLYARGSALADPAKAAAIRDFVQHWIVAAQWSKDNEDAWIDAYYVHNQKLSPEEGRAIVESEGDFWFPPLDDDLIATQQETVDVLYEAGDLPERLDAADQFDTRFDPVIDEAVSKVDASRVAVR
ncbi:ABC transporter substrate-binding protein [Saccharomonospora glauca]|uniref:ABC-type nitrate/sulfonate/bicarbonate transport system, periplasmic component n=1 Tax=Saccharomonospora glauca K62 TaxID=928724 RepID=I1D1G7_9PSEU|nr:ABC transporter substrate-binding protein [Saccharomonospora glauca]EIE98791.1 ABC-type nitrate/sulfonate/bicarbonate transport system, periplasmic component [Saccharomonospora glauca K62]